MFSPVMFLECGENDTLITFDDLSTGGQIPPGYFNMIWDNANYHNRTTHGVSSGYYTATVSGNYISYNANGNSMHIRLFNGSLLTLKSAVIAAAWNDNLQLEIVGYRSDSVIINRTFTLQVFEGQYLNFTGYSRLNKVSFSSFGGTRNSNVRGDGHFFAMDDLCCSFEIP